MRKFIGQIIAWFLAPVEQEKSEKPLAVRTAFDSALTNGHDHWADIDSRSPLIVGNGGIGLTDL